MLSKSIKDGIVSYYHDQLNIWSIYAQTYIHACIHTGTYIHTSTSRFMCMCIYKLSQCGYRNFWDSFG